jgi:hypothetical protein
VHIVYSATSDESAQPHGAFCGPLRAGGGARHSEATCIGWNTAKYNRHRCQLRSASFPQPRRHLLLELDLLLLLLLLLLLSRCGIDAEPSGVFRRGRPPIHDRCGEPPRRGEVSKSRPVSEAAPKATGAQLRRRRGRGHRQQQQQEE